MIVLSWILNYELEIRINRLIFGTDNLPSTLI